MYIKYVAWDKFTPHALNTYHLYHNKGTPQKTIARDYICLDTETSHGYEDIEEEYLPDPIILDMVEGVELYISDRVKNNIDYKYYSLIMRRAKIKRSLNPYALGIHELYDRCAYLLPDVIEESDQLRAILDEVDNALEISDKIKNRQEQKEIGWVYQWAFSYPYNNGDRMIVYGRTPSQLAACMEDIATVNNTDENNKILIFAHNWSYDYTYIHAFLNEQFNERGTILATAAHKIISYNIHGLEFRDSLKISQKSLAKWGKDLNVEHPKLTGLIDYNVRRFQDTPLTRNDWKYMFRDVITLDECIAAQLALWEDTTKTIPLTATGYVRRETRKLFRKNKRNRELFNKKALSMEAYQFCRCEFAGGLTHGNRYYAERTIDIEEIRNKLGRSDVIIKHRDFASHYPSQQICTEAPESKFILSYDHEQDEKHKCLYVEDLQKMDCCFLAMMQVSNVHIRQGMTLPYFQLSKALAGAVGVLDYTADNGRILHIDKGFTNIVVNEHDLKWLVKMYTFDYKILKVYTADKGEYPDFMREAVFKFFEGKTRWKKEAKKLKKAHGENSPEYIAAEIQTMCMKSLLNSIFGMSCTNPVRTSFTEDEDDEWSHELLDDDEIYKRLLKYYGKRSSFMNYELGLWTTSSARDELLSFAELIGWDHILYTDTDSLFYISTPEIEQKIDERNRLAREECDKNGWYIEIDGERTYFNQLEDEQENIIKFRFLHSKCYAYVTDDNELHCTIAGVPERTPNLTRVEELGDIDNLVPGKVFHECGGTMTRYPGYGDRVDPRVVEVEGRDIELSSYAIITPTTKELKNSIAREEVPFFWELEECYG